MDWDGSEANWKQIRGGIKEQWAELTDGHLDSIAGKRDALLDRIQENYGVARDDAEREVEDWESSNRHLFPGSAA